MSFVSWATPWKPATIGIASSSSAAMDPPGVTLMILARPWVESVIRPACEPVYERASTPRSWIAIASTAMEMRSPAVSSMSSSRAAGAGLTRPASSIRSSVVSPIAETTTATSCPAALVATIRRATRWTLAASLTDEPPYFWTTRATVVLSCVGVGHAGARPSCAVAESTEVRSATLARPHGGTWGGFARTRCGAQSSVSGIASSAAPDPVSSGTSSRTCAISDCRARSAADAPGPQVDR